MPRLLAALLGLVAVAALLALGIAITSGGGNSGCVDIPGGFEPRASEEFTLEASVRPESASALPLDKWSTVALVSGGDRVRFYVNGERAGSVRTDGIASGEGRLQLGCARIWDGFEGRIANVRVYDRALDATEISAGVPPRMYWGAWLDHEDGQSPFEIGAQRRFESLVGKTASLIQWSSPWEASQFCEDGGSAQCPFRAAEFDKVRSHGSIPFFSWAPNFLSWPGPGAAPTDREIANGVEDGYVRKWAEAARDWGHPLFLRFAWEMNGSWFRWGVGEFEENGKRFINTPADYVAMWRHVHRVFAEAGADNVTWVWCPSVDPHHKHAAMSSLYPGGEYVDWTCLDGYNWDKPWTSFDSLFQSSYETIADRIAPGKPLVIGETASTERGGSKREWIEAMFSSLASGYPKVRGLLWFDVENEGPGDWSVESSAGATEAFAAGIQSGLFVGADYGALETTPIPPP